MTGTEITWDKYALKIGGVSKFLLGGEFHYWRVPDPERWRDVLNTYKIAGLNSLRIYFHWGFHNIREGDYRWDGNRDVDALLNICEDLGFYVFVAAGPYICAETQAGGYPLWMAARRDIRVKHLKGTLRQKYDPTYMQACRDWWQNFVQQIKHHQITENPKGCVVAFQIENEYMEKMVILKASRRYMQELVQIAKDAGVTVPTFHDDGMPLGSWNGVVDLYGFNKYLIHAPKHPKTLPMPAWSLDQFAKRMDKTEQIVRGFKPPACETPMFIPELQGGWYNHWTIKYGYDELYNYYGAPYQRMVVESFAAQGATIMTLYMFFGGTNYGAISNPEVYTSYDYSACMREYGFQSERLRLLRLFALFARSFEKSLVATEFVDHSGKADVLPPPACSTPKIFYRHRRSLDFVDFFFFRNFTPEAAGAFYLTLQTPTGEMRVPREGEIKIAPRESFVAVANCTLGGFLVEFCAMPILVQGPFAGATIVVVEQNGGELILAEDSCVASGDIKMLERRASERGTRFTFDKPGMGTISGPEGKKLYVVCLSRSDALTLNADFSGPELQAAWGAYSNSFTPSGALELETTGAQEVFLLSSKHAPPFNVVSGAPVPGVQRGAFGTTEIPPEVTLGEWARRQTPFDAGEFAPSWKEIDFATQRDAIDHGYLSGHVLYRCEFTGPATPQLSLQLNARHKAGAWLNGQYVGGHWAYDVGVGKPGAINGPDRKGKGAKLNLAAAVKAGERNVLHVLVETLGQSKQVWLINDIRNPRGILQAKFSTPIPDAKWRISGIDVRTIPDPYNTSGLAGETLQLHLGKGSGWVPCDATLHITPNDQVVWHKTQFSWQVAADRRIPLRLHVDGTANVNIFLNGLYVGRYWGEQGPQHDFYLMDGILKNGLNVLVLASWTGQETDIRVEIRPYKVDPRSGNLDEVNGTIFTTKRQVVQ